MPVRFDAVRVTHRILRSNEFQEMDRMFLETDKKMNALQDLFDSEWSKLVESLAEGDLVRLLREHGIQITE
ncbi:hypothetical protein [Candidatus Thiosymbion oneisti]|uniref:hypothetical protein n=1 Tax=Candidatus Thiosymbion oneisti TaxID=589554 RepID=UPI0013FD7E9F|nr:hypothetical protein [Candidatus Thiosymbion oneisti]